MKSSSSSANASDLCPWSMVPTSLKDAVGAENVITTPVSKVEVLIYSKISLFHNKANSLSGTLEVNSFP